MKEGYDFLGWYDNSSLTGNSISSIGTNEEGDKYFYAKWEEQSDYLVDDNGEYILDADGNLIEISKD